MQSGKLWCDMQPLQGLLTRYPISKSNDLSSNTGRFINSLCRLDNRVRADRDLMMLAPLVGSEFDDCLHTYTTIMPELLKTLIDYNYRLLEYFRSKGTTAVDKYCQLSCQNIGIPRKNFSPDIS